LALGRDREALAFAILEKKVAKLEIRNEDGQTVLLKAVVQGSQAIVEVKTVTFVGNFMGSLI
jgi:hypothetical protein